MKYRHPKQQKDAVKGYEFNRLKGHKIMATLKDIKKTLEIENTFEKPAIKIERYYSRQNKDFYLIRLVRWDGWLEERDLLKKGEIWQFETLQAAMAYLRKAKITDIIITCN